MIVTIGTDDTLASPGAQLDYYQAIIDTMGRDVVDSFARLFVIPQATHGLTGRTAAQDGDGRDVPVVPLPTRFERVPVLLDWVERGIAPPMHLTVTAGDRSLPLCSYPAYPHYSSGPPEAASSYQCQAVCALKSGPLYRQSPVASRQSPVASRQSPVETDKHWEPETGDCTAGRLPGHAVTVLAAVKPADHRRIRRRDIVLPARVAALAFTTPSRYAPDRRRFAEWSCPVEKSCAAPSLRSVPQWCRRTAGEAQAPRPAGARTRPANEPFGYCLNTSTIRGNNLDIVGVVNAASKAGFHAIEPWIREIDDYTSKGGTLKDLGKRIADAGLTVEDAIAFNSFLDDDDARRAASMEKLKVDMDKVAQIGGKRIAAPPGNNRAAVSLDNAAKYYREALEMGEKMGVQPLLELWGTHPVLGPLSHGIYVTVAAGRADASLLLDVFHLYKSGTPFTALKQINGASLHVMHLNDYPQAADPSTLNDGNRIYPGDGVAPLRQILRDLRDSGFRGYLSLELFNRDYWTHSADENLKTAMEKIRATVRSAMA